MQTWPVILLTVVSLTLSGKEKLVPGTHRVNASDVFCNISYDCNVGRAKSCGFTLPKGASQLPLEGCTFLHCLMY